MIDILYPEGIVFCGNQMVVMHHCRAEYTYYELEALYMSDELETLHTDDKLEVLSMYGVLETLHVYDVLKGVQLSEVLLPSRAYHEHTHWGHRDSDLLVTSSEIDGKIMIDTWDPQPISSPPFPVIESFLLQPHEGKFSFSPVSFHASFLTTREVVILNVRDSKILLRTEKTDREYCGWSGRFSPDGRFFAYMTEADEIHVWKNMSTSYVPWSNLVPQFPEPRGFAFSPSATSILIWGKYGIELLDNHLRPPSPKNTRHRCRTGAHLVACSADGTHIATARSLEGVVTILDPLLDTPQRHINTNMRILDIKIFDNVLFVADEHELVSWDLGVVGTGRDAHGVRRATLDRILGTGLFTLSNDCSQIAVAARRTVLLYDIKTQEILNEYAMENMGQGLPRRFTTVDIWDIRFSPDGHQLWLLLQGGSPPHYCETLHTTKDLRSAGATWESLEDGWSQGSRFPPPGYRIWVGSGWVEGPGGKKLLWLPPNWRTERMTEAMWDGNFLALVGGHHPEPIIIEFRPQPFLPYSCSTHSSNP